MPGSLRVALMTRRIRSITAKLVGLGVAGMVFGFAWFLWALPEDEVALDRNADGIVVLTGGTSRISDAIDLLASGRGRRLLITGVHPTTNTRDISRQIPDFGRVSCCVDLDHSALNTLGNAIETRRWAHDHNFRSLIVVTSSYHMPRAMAELSHQLPDVALIPFPVRPGGVHGDPWWASGPMTKLIVSEYVKYVVALVRMRLDNVAGIAGASRLSQLGRT
jgi:uncharacterized SAM-binding protein YcdF (DUF218 family)